MCALIIVADDYGLRPAYDRGIAEAALAGAVDAVSAMALRDGLDPGPLVDCGVEIGLHLELEGRVPADEDEARRAAERELDAFERRFGRPPAYLDGHHHRHATPPFEAAVAHIARERGLAVRSVDGRHRHVLRGLGVATPDRLVGRLAEDEPALPAQIERLLAGEPPPAGVTEWMVHPGRRDPDAASSYDAGREQDLALLLELAASPSLRAERATHRRALRPA